MDWQRTGETWKKEDLGGRIVDVIFPPLSAKLDEYFEQFDLKSFHFFPIKKALWIDM
ncbi:MAG: hypothetical protein WBA93_02455 [Microcoleaceae cyanobacterium]